MRVIGINGIHTNTHIYIYSCVIKKTRPALQIKINPIKVCECDYFKIKCNKVSNNYKRLAVILCMSSLHLLKYESFIHICMKNLQSISFNLTDINSFIYLSRHAYIMIDIFDVCGF